jgi:hypothetical protein
MKTNFLPQFQYVPRFVEEEATNISNFLPAGSSSSGNTGSSGDGKAWNIIGNVLNAAVGVANIYTAIKTTSPVQAAVTNNGNSTPTVQTAVNQPAPTENKKPNPTIYIIGMVVLVVVLIVVLLIRKPAK